MAGNALYNLAVKERPIYIRSACVKYESPTDCGLKFIVEVKVFEGHL